MSNRKATYGTHVALTNELLDDPAWRELKHSEMILWVYLRSKFNCQTFTTLTLCPSELKGVMGERTFRRAMKGLIDKGWVEVVFHGGLPKIRNQYKLKGPHAYFIYKGMKIW